MFTEFWHQIGADRARLLPLSASTFADDNDRLMIFLLTVSMVSILAIFFTLCLFVYKYRRRPGNEIAKEVKTSAPLEIAWAVIPFSFIFVAYFWGARSYITMLTSPEKGERISVVAKQWMWKFEHENGVGEIDQLHIPVGRDVSLIMISQDVIHSFFIPDFRVKYDVLPGRYSRTWFRAEKEGEYFLLCTQYCGTDHALMKGTVIAMSDTDYQAWLTSKQRSLAAASRPENLGHQLYNSQGCASCHDSTELGGRAIGPAIVGNFRRGDEDHLRASILRPSAQIAAGYADVMPVFAGRLSETDLLNLIAYLESDHGVKKASREVKND
jgi:cytochrome c oxidase subunit 2